MPILFENNFLIQSHHRKGVKGGSRKAKKNPLGNDGHIPQITKESNTHCKVKWRRFKIEINRTDFLHRLLRV